MESHYKACTSCYVVWFYGQCNLKNAYGIIQELRGLRNTLSAKLVPNASQECGDLVQRCLVISTKERGIFCHLLEELVSS